MNVFQSRWLEWKPSKEGGAKSAISLTKAVKKTSVTYGTAFLEANEGCHTLGANSEGVFQSPPSLNRKDLIDAAYLRICEFYDKESKIRPISKTVFDIGVKTLDFEFEPVILNGKDIEFLKALKKWEMGWLRLVQMEQADEARILSALNKVIQTPRSAS